MCITPYQLEYIQTNPCIHLSYLEDQRNLKIYNENIFKKKKIIVHLQNLMWVNNSHPSCGHNLDTCPLYAQSSGTIKVNQRPGKVRYKVEVIYRPVSSVCEACT